jgi:hypothetical protein
MTTLPNPAPKVRSMELCVPESGAWGFLVTNSLPRNSRFCGMSRFVWFADRSTLEAQLASMVVCFDDSGMNEIPLSRYAPELVPEVQTWSEGSPSLEEKRAILARGFHEDAVLAWVGSFEDLCQANGNLECGVRLWYRQSEGLAVDESPIPATEQGAFAHALQGYGL